MAVNYCNTTINGSLTITSIANETSAAGKFLVSDSNGVVKYRTGAEVLSDIGGAPATGGSYLPLAGGTMTGNTIHNDNVKSIYGTGSDLEVYHDGDNAYIDNNDGHLYIRNNVDDDTGKNIYLQAKSGEDGIIINDDSSVQLYNNNILKFNTTSSGVTVTGELTVSTIANATADPDKFLCANGSGKVGYRTGAQVLSDIGAAPATGGAYLPLAGGTMTGDTLHGDNVKAIYGTGSDLEVYHNSGSSYVGGGGTGKLFLEQTKGSIYLGSNADPTLFIDSINKKVGFRTTSPGAAFDVNGTTRVRNQLNVGHTTEQNLYVDGNGAAGGKYVKMGNYGQGNYFGITTGLTNQPKYVAAYGSAGKMVEERRIVTIKLSGSAFSNLSSTGTTLLAAPGVNSIILPYEILIYKDTGTTGTGWPSSNPSSGAEIGFCQGNSINCSLTNAFDPVWKLPRTLVTKTGTWFWNRSNASANEMGTPNTFQLNKALVLRSATNLTALPTASWYIQIRYAQMNYSSGLINNVDITKTTNG